MTVHLHIGDLPAAVADALAARGTVAVDTETMGLRPDRDRLCLVQLSGGDGDAHLVQFPAPGFGARPDYAAPNLRRLLADTGVDRKSVVLGTRVSVRVVLGGVRI